MRTAAISMTAGASMSDDSFMLGWCSSSQGRGGAGEINHHVLLLVQTHQDL
jgi:hypothetical protein